MNDVQAQSKAIKLLGWEDIDHSQTLDLGCQGSTSLVFRKDFDSKRDTLNYMVLRFCDRCDFTPEKSQLVEMAYDNASFLSTGCLFDYNQKVFVGSELADMSLADIIDCTIPMDEVHLSTILDQVSFLTIPENQN